MCLMLHLHHIFKKNGIQEERKLFLSIWMIVMIMSLFNEYFFQVYIWIIWGIGCGLSLKYYKEKASANKLQPG